MWESPELLLVVLSLHSIMQSLVLKVSTCAQTGAVCRAMATQLTCILLHCFSALLTSSSTLVIIAHRPSTCHTFSSVHVHRYQHCRCNAPTGHAVPPGMPGSCAHPPGYYEVPFLHSAAHWRPDLKPPEGLSAKMQHAHPPLAGLLPALSHLSAQRSILPPPVVHSTLLESSL